MSYVRLYKRNKPFEKSREALMDIELRLRKWKKKTISKPELQELLNVSTDVELYNAVSDAVEAGMLSPVKASGTSGNRRYPLYLKYRITIENDYTDALYEIALLHPILTQNGYLSSNPSAFLDNKETLAKLNQYFFSRHGDIAVSRKERSFEIFGEEKELDRSKVRALLNNIGLTAQKLGLYDTPEYCFNDFIPIRKESMVLLICENKDIWFNIRRRMYEDHASEIFNTHIDGTLYGCGNRISEAGALSGYTDFMGAKTVQYLYWGDIDRAGLNIYLSLKKNNPTLSISLFTEAYIRMLALAQAINIPDSDDHRELIGDYTELYSGFPQDSRQALIRCIDENKRIPQEIINYERLLADMR